MLRRLFTLLFVLSLLLCSGVCVLWVWSAHYRTEFSFREAGAAEEPDGGLFLRLGPREITLLRTLPHGPGNAKAQAVVTEAIRDSDLTFSQASGGGIVPKGTSMTFVSGSALMRLVQRPTAEHDQPLLHLLRNPGTFVMAHSALSRRAGDGWVVEGVTAARPESGFAWTGMLNGVRMAMPHSDSRRPVLVDQSQIATLAARWRVRLARPAVSVPFWVAAVCTAGIPVWWAVRFLRVRLRTRRLRTAGLCAACGYDLRATPSYCPECGAKQTAKEAA
jgi:hypothetical protein